MKHRVHCLRLSLLVLCGVSAASADHIADHNLARAAALGDKAELAKALKMGANINFQFKEEGGLTPLMAASFSGHVDVVEILLKAGADTSIRGPLGGQAIHLAVGQCREKVVEKLLAAKVKLDTTDKGLTPLMMGMTENCAGTISLLLSAGDPVNAAQRDGWTPLMHAAAVGSPKVISLLLKAGANREQKNAEGETAADVARKAGHADAAKLLLGEGKH